VVITLENYTKLAFAKSDGLLPAIVQHPLSGEVLMQAYMDKQAAKITLEQQRVTFFSRSQQRLWQKGETSGHVLKLVSMHLSSSTASGPYLSSRHS
jgi:phosphoribosyl-AMP cyclohydrolase / phosphoribosyl-ATP pyrophosphohydrolase